METPDEIYVEHSADEWVNGKYLPLYEGGTQWAGNKTEYHHSRIVEALKVENEKLQKDIEYWMQKTIDAVNLQVELKAKLDKAKDALEFYGDSHEYPNDGAFGSGSTDFGQRARTTLEEIK